jgi:hypothetical protein
MTVSRVIATAVILCLIPVVSTVLIPVLTLKSPFRTPISHFFVKAKLHIQALIQNLSKQDRPKMFKLMSVDNAWGSSQWIALDRDRIEQDRVKVCYSDSISLVSLTHPKKRSPVQDHLMSLSY